jgi:MATE family multidrug resistance protein
LTDVDLNNRCDPSRRFADEFSALLRLGAPMVATQFFIMAMGFIDTAMAGRYDSTHLAGVALGGSILWPVFMLTTGFTMAITPIVAQLRGSGAVQESGAQVRQGLWLGLAASALCVLVVTNAAPIFAFVEVEPAVRIVAQDYLDATAWGLPAVQIYIVLRYTAEGLGRTVPPMVIAGLALPVNAALNYVFIYGHFGAPELGGEGCGWATTAVWWVELLLIITLLRSHYFSATRLVERFDWPNWQIQKSILKIGVPIGLTVFLEMAVFSVVGLSIASLGVVALAANSIAGNVNWATYVLPSTLGAAASIRVGFYVGAKDYTSAAYVARTAFILSIAYAVTVSAAIILFRYQIAGIYTQDAPVLELAATLMIFIAVYQIVDDTLATMGGTLRGYKDTRMPMVYSLLGFWCLALPLGAALCFGWFGLEPRGVPGYWIGMTFGLTVVAALTGFRLISTSRNHGRIVAFSGI